VEVRLHLFLISALDGTCCPLHESAALHLVKVKGKVHPRTGNECPEWQGVDV